MYLLSFIGSFILFVLVVFFSYRYFISLDRIQRYYFISAFFITLSYSIAFDLIYTYYYQFGDTLLYQESAKKLFNLIITNPIKGRSILFGQNKTLFLYLASVYEQVAHTYNTSSLNMIRLTTGLLFFSFGKKWILVLCFSVISFFTKWKLFQFFRSQTIYVFFSWAIIFLLPTFMFWTSGVLKDTLIASGCFFLLMELEKLRRKKILILLLSVCLLFFLKPFLLFIIFLSYTLYFFIRQIYFKRRFFLIVLGSFILLVAIFSIYILEDYWISRIQTFHNWHKILAMKGQFGYNFGAIDYTFFGIIKLIPQACLVSWLRPFFWETKTIFQFLVSLENFLLLVACLYFFFKRKSKKIIPDFGMLCFLFFLIYSVVIGIISYNFGALSRYISFSKPLVLFAFLNLLTDRSFKSENP